MAEQLRENPERRKLRRETARKFWRDEDRKNNEWRERRRKYRFFLKGAIWARIRRRKLWAVKCCEECGRWKKLEVHHKTYERCGGNERMDDLMVLCCDCHRKRHRK